MPVQKEVGDCCLCIPLRVGVGLLCVYTFCHGMICVLGKFIGDVRLQSGGYAPLTNGLQVDVGVFGVIFGVTGMLGVIDNKLGMIKWYNYFQYLKLCVSFIVFIADMRELRLCDTWSNNINSQIAYNAPIDTISLKGLCGWTRQAYVLGFFLDFTMQCYFTWVSYIYYERMQSIPPYFLTFESHAAKGDNHLRMTFFDPDIGEVGAHLDRNATAKMTDQQREKVLKDHHEKYGSTDTVGPV